LRFRSVGRAQQQHRRGKAYGLAPETVCPWSSVHISP
jgi:hypothetical protein